MKPHVHVGVLTAIIVFLSVLIVGFFWRMAALKMQTSDNPTVEDIGRAMIHLY